ncbi:uncharacterized protein LOC135463312 [Liolophura sinensis]|uniref:uncharacterized protein LOC135463312 n=1 Tax=Liolophura sinensis TaxID=3198878 RepID=UPI00315817EF
MRDELQAPTTSLWFACILDIMWGLLVLFNWSVKLEARIQQSPEWSSENGKLTIVAKEKEMQTVMGQRQKLSFFDVKLANFMFCSAFCGEKVFTAKESEQTFTSPSFDSSTLENEVTCAWHIKAPPHTRVRLSIAELFDIGYEQYSCEEYVEIRYKGTDSTGTRLCSSNTTIHDIVSYDNEVLVLFRSVPKEAKDSRSRWFRLSYAVTDGCGGCSPEETAPMAKPCPRRTLYDCSPDSGYDQEWARCGFNVCSPGTSPQRDPTSGLCKVEELKPCPFQTGYKKCLQTRYEPCPENHLVQPCCAHYTEDVNTGECVPEASTTTATASAT